MRLEDLRQVWNEGSQMSAAQTTINEAKLRDSFRSFESAIARRDLIESIAAIAVIVFFSFSIWKTDLPGVAIAGCAVIILGAIEIMIVMGITRRMDRPTSHEVSILDYSRLELRRLDRQIRLLKNVTTWYSAPILIGCAIFFLGIMLQFRVLPTYLWLAFLGAFWLCIVWAGHAVYRLNKKEIDNRLLPMRQELSELIAGLSAQTHGEDKAPGDVDAQGEDKGQGG